MQHSHLSTTPQVSNDRLWSYSGWRDNSSLVHVPIQGGAGRSRGVKEYCTVLSNAVPCFRSEARLFRLAATILQTNSYGESYPLIDLNW
jgi:hypothetical protein